MILDPLVVELGPAVVVGAGAERLAVALVLALAVDAGVGVRQGIEPGLGDLAAAELATSVNALDDSLQGVLDLTQLAALDLDELRADLVVGGIDGGVDVVADDVRGGEFAKRSMSPFRALRSASRRATSREWSRSKASLRAILHLLVYVAAGQRRPRSDRRTRTVVSPHSRRFPTRERTTRVSRSVRMMIGTSSLAGRDIERYASFIASVTLTLVESFETPVKHIMRHGRKPPSFGR